MEVYTNIFLLTGRTTYWIDLLVQGPKYDMELQTSINCSATLGLENPMENVQVHDLMCYCTTFD